MKRFLAPALLLLALGSAAAAQDHRDVVGRWDLDVAWPQAPSRVVLTVEGDDSELSARWEGPRGALDATGVSYAGGELRFTLEVTTTTDGSTFTTTKLPFRADVANDRLEGTLRAPNGADLAVEGARAAQTAR